MHKYALVLWCVCLPLLVRAQMQEIDISGKVTTAGGVAIAGARVELRGANLSTVTDTAGRYSITKSSATSITTMTGHSSVGLVHPNGRTLAFEIITGVARVKVDIYGLTGRHLFSALDQNMTGGRYTMNLVRRPLSAGLYCVRVWIGGNLTVLKILTTDGLKAQPAGPVRVGGSCAKTILAQKVIIDTLRAGAHGYIPTFIPMEKLQTTLNVTLKKASVTYFGNHIGGYQGPVTSGGFVPKEWNGGYSMYTAAWELFETYPGNWSQTGLYGTWMHVEKTENPPKTIYCDIEGGLGWWRNTRYINETPKFIMGAVCDYFSLIANGPGAGNGDYWGDPKGLYGVAQLTPWLLFPPDGLNLKQGVSGELFGYGYLPLPLTNPKNTTEGKNIKTGNNCWTLFLNTENFKGPVAFVLPYFWSKPYVGDPRLEGLYFDSKLTNPGGSISMESQHMPAVQTTTPDSATYARVASLLFPREENGNTVTVHNLFYYKTSALWDSVQTWFNGGSATSGYINSSEYFHRTFSRHGGEWSIWENPYSGGTKRSVPWDTIRTSNALDPYTNVIEWKRKHVKEVVVRGKPFNLFPEYLRLTNNSWHPVTEEEVPDESGLKDYNFPEPKYNHEPYTTPDESNSVWKKPGPVAGPFYAYPADGSKVTYYWYKFKDQPAMLMADMTDSEREIVQQRVEKLHRTWTKDRNYLAPPEINKPLASLDPAVVVTPPVGLEIGYVPIVTRQELAK